jgi:hypothetical protein
MLAPPLAFPLCNADGVGRLAVLPASRQAAELSAGLRSAPVTPFVKS